MTGPKWPARELSVNIGSPYSSFENDDEAFKSLQQLAGRGSDYLGIEYEWDKNVWGRIGLTTTSFYLSRAFQHYGHEIAHDFDIEDKGYIDVTDWSDPFSPIPMPEYKPASGELVGDRPEEFWETVAGLNRDEYSAYTVWKRCMLSGVCAFDNRTYFLVLKLNDFSYAIETETGWNAGDDETSRRYSHRYNDIDSYVRLLNADGIPKMTKGGYGAQIAISDLFSGPVVESVYSVLNYLIRGKRENHVASLRITEDFAIAPPLTSLYLTSDGSFYNNSMFFFLGEKAIELCVGTDIDPLGGRLNTLRFGGSYHGLRFDPVEVNPSAALDVERSTFDPKGFSSSLEFFLNLTHSAAVRFKVEYNRDDVMENTVKREADGGNLVLGIKVKI